MTPILYFCSEKVTWYLVQLVQSIYQYKISNGYNLLILFQSNHYIAYISHVKPEEIIESKTLIII